ncbi:hypothetical protein Tco_0904886 [Tanacetum coccineum]
MDIECVMPPVRTPVQTLTLPKWSSGSLPVSPTSLTVPLPIAPPSLVEPVDKGYLDEIGAQLELHGGILHDHTHRLDALPPTLLEGIGRDITELYDRSAVNATTQRELRELRDCVTALEQEMSRREE